MHSSSWNKPSFLERLSSSIPRMYRPNDLSETRWHDSITVFRMTAQTMCPRRLTVLLGQPRQTNIWLIETKRWQLHPLSVCSHHIVDFYQHLYDSPLNDKRQAGSEDIQMQVTRQIDRVTKTLWQTSRDIKRIYATESNSYSSWESEKTSWSHLCSVLPDKNTTQQSSGGDIESEKKGWN